jgi:hypothetical protein
MLERVALVTLLLVYFAIVVVACGGGDAMTFATRRHEVVPTVVRASAKDATARAAGVDVPAPKESLKAVLVGNVGSAGAKAITKHAPPLPGSRGKAPRLRRKKHARGIP